MIQERVCHIHAGTHKTASTYIQSRLKRNQSFLRRHNLLYPPLRRHHLVLANALRKGEMGPWIRLLQSAMRTGREPLVSAEIFAELLHQPAPWAQSQLSAAGSTLFSNLASFLEKHNMRLHLVVFVRDQPAYLNSRYTQLIKRFYFDLPFDRYVRRTISRGGKGECDYETLFGEALAHPAVDLSVLPFRSGEADPCDRLLKVVGVPNLQQLPPLQKRSNTQPGWKTVWLARHLGQRLRDSDPVAWRDRRLKARLRKALDQLAIEQGWPAEPYQGLDAELLASLEHRYAASNERFAERVWGCSWREMFPSSQPRQSPQAPRSPDERRQLQLQAERLLDQVLNR